MLLKYGNRHTMEQRNGIFEAAIILADHQDCRWAWSWHQWLGCKRQLVRQVRFRGLCFMNLTLIWFHLGKHATGSFRMHPSLLVPSPLQQLMTFALAATKPNLAMTTANFHGRCFNTAIAAHKQLKTIEPSCYHSKVETDPPSNSQENHIEALPSKKPQFTKSMYELNYSLQQFWHEKQWKSIGGLVALNLSFFRILDNDIPHWIITKWNHYQPSLIMPSVRHDCVLIKSRGILKSSLTFV